MSIHPKPKNTNNTANLRGFFLAGTAITPLHPGSGRSLGEVDLTIQRDPLGYPIVFASSIKGALKNLCIRKKASENLRYCVDKETGIAKCGDQNCEAINICCCLFGSEIGGEESQQALISILDFIPLALPLPSANEGYVYVSTPLLLMKASLIAEALGYENISKELSILASSKDKEKKESSEKIVVTSPAVKEPRITDIAGSTIKVVSLPSGDSNFKELKKLTQNLGGLAANLLEKLLIVPDEVGPTILDRGLLRVTRIRIRKDRKTVAEGSLWTEEYIPSGTVFLGGILITPTHNKNCDSVGIDTLNTKNTDIVSKVADEFKNIIGGNIFYFIVGGKETVGKGLVKTYVYGLNTENQVI